MKRTWMIGGAAALALASTQSAAFGQAATATRTAAPVEALAKDYVAQNRTQGIVVAYGVGDSAPVFASAGRIAVEADAAAATPDSLWRVYSMTKPITAMAAMMLVEDGKLKLDQPISDFFPGFRTMKVLTDPANSLDSRPATTQITVRHLVTHTAGLGYSIITKGPLLKEYERLGITPAAVNAALEAQARPLRPTSLKEFAERVATLPLIAEPGTKWSYSISLDLLPAIIEAAAGMPYEQFLQTRMLTPLKMTSTYWTVPQSEIGRFATNYAWAGENRIPFDPAKTSAWLTPPSFPYGGAGLVMSARDYDRFLHMLANGGAVDGVRVMKAETVRLAMSDLLPAGVTFGGAPSGSGGAAGPKMGYGAGGSVQLEDVPGGAGKGTYGWGGAAGTVAWVDPSKKIRGTVMVNYFPSDKWPLRADAVKAVYAQAAR
ncbi:serine hydrolase domain-containing protein [Sphingomonas sp.]|jgi:CubicO group peptidase (beta-lactamase class C family)|uniref:serine hydrolase domain-containing protein n=1 Tax=Sphingomonas sp. TaxID=28214 RepID=UPI002E123176|nr:serine hydrolase domain-containing protein [Sphingomonas sp.]